MMAQLTNQPPDIDQAQLAQPTEAASRARHTNRISVITALAMLVFTLYNVYTASLTPTWQQYTHIGLTAAVGVVAALSAWLSRRGRSNLGIGLLIGVIWLALFIAPFTVAGLGSALGLAAILMTSGLAGLTLPTRPARWAISGSVFVGLLIFLNDLFGPERPSAVSPPVVFGLLFGIILIYSVFVARQFRNYSVRTKLIAAFLVVTVVAVGAIAFFNSRSTTAALEEQLGNNLRSLADSLAISIGGELIRQVDLLRTLAAGRPLQASLSTANMFRTAGSLSEIQAEMLSRDQLWATAPDSDRLVQSVIAGTFAKQFRDIQARFPDHVELFVTDQYGGLVAATHRTSDYYQADEEWWQLTFNNGRGAVYIGQPEFDASSNTLAINMAAPVFDDSTGNLVGVLRSTYRLEALTELLAAVQTGDADLYLPGGKALTAGKVGINPVEPETAAQLETFAERNYTQFPYQGVPSLVSQSPVRAITGESIIDQLGWRIVVHQPEAEAFAPVVAQTQASLLLALVILGLAAAVAVGMAQLLAGPISRLTNVAGRVAEGDLSAWAEVESQDEIGQLAGVFNTMTAQLRQIIGSLEEQVAGRTRQLATVVQVNQRLAGILELSDLLRQVVVLIKETFDYYHVHIYLLEGETLLMVEGYGEAGAAMKRQGHHISLTAPKSLVARAARQGQIITIGNVREEPDWLPNPLLPHTQAEMAVPVMLGAEVVGVLDVQSEHVGGLTPADENTLAALANQVAIAVRNARAFAETQQALYEAQRLQRLYTEQAWEQFRAARRTTDYEVRQAEVPPLPETPTPEVEAALTQAQTVTLITNGKPAPLKAGQSNGGALAEAEPEVKAVAAKSRNALATPLKLRDQIIGVLGLHDENPDRRWTAEEIALIETVSEQMSLAIENARLFEHTQRDAWRNQLVSETTARVWASSEIEEVMRAAVAELGDKLRASEVVIRLGTESKLEEEQL